MAPVQVSTIVNEMFQTFDCSLDIYRDSRRGQSRRYPMFSATTDEQNMATLRMRSKEIRQKYELGAAKHGSAFEQGDSMAQIKLAQVLMGFQTGLVQIFDLPLSNDHKQRAQARKSTMHLSAMATEETITILSELEVRLTAASALEAFMPSSRMKSSVMARQSASSRSGSEDTVSRTQPARRPPPTPKLDKRGGWVRSRSNPSVITVVPASKMTKPTSRSVSSSRSSDTATDFFRRSPSVGQKVLESPASPRAKKTQLAQKAAGKVKHMKSRLTPLPGPRDNFSDVSQTWTKHDITHSPTRHTRSVSDEKTEVQRQPSMYIVTSDFLNNLAAHTPEARQDVWRSEQPPPRPYKPVQLRAQPYTAAHVDTRPRPPSMMTFMTASTRLGEVPVHKRPDYTPTRDEIEARPIPYVLPPLLEPARERKRFRFWGRRERFVTGVGA